MLLKILSERRLQAADEDLNILESVSYPIFQVIKKADKGELVYDLGEKDLVKVMINNDTISTVNNEKIKNSLNRIFIKIRDQKASTGSFELPEANELMESLICNKFKSSSGDKTDITIAMDDLHTGTKPIVGFSIKSRLGGPSTLLNASGSTNFVYRVDFPNGAPVQNLFKDKIQLIEITEAGGSITFDHMDSKTFQENLINIESKMPEIIAEMLKNYYLGKASSLKEAIDVIQNENTLGLGFSKVSYEIKVKNLLSNIALGFMPNKPWDGSTVSHGGYIIVRNDGEVVCYHLYNFDRFQNYLLGNTRFESPSTTRHKYGKLFQTPEGYFLKLNLQIRFIK